MLLLADENVPRIAVDALRARGHEVAWIHEDTPGIVDQSILDRAGATRRLLVTFDKDFGELVFRDGLPAPGGVVLFRIPTSSPGHVADVMVEILESRSDWTGHFSVVDERRIRMTRLGDHIPEA